jgi:aconitate hydratase
MESLGLDGTEVYSVTGLEVMNDGVTPSTVTVTATKADGTTVSFNPRLRIDTPMELAYYRHGGILQYVLRQLAGKA